MLLSPSLSDEERDAEDQRLWQIEREADDEYWDEQESIVGNGFEESDGGEAEEEAVVDEVEESEFERGF